jgi:hypothetical protein
METSGVAEIHLKQRDRAIPVKARRGFAFGIA